jgi:hypothetical protein
MNTENDGERIESDMTESELWGESGKLRAQLTDHAQHQLVTLATERILLLLVPRELWL